MLMSGAPDPCADHAEQVANMSMEMAAVVQTVKSPLDGKPLHVSTSKGRGGVSLVKMYSTCKE